MGKSESVSHGRYSLSVKYAATTGRVNLSTCFSERQKGTKENLVTDIGRNMGQLMNLLQHVRFRRLYSSDIFFHCLF